MDLLRIFYIFMTALFAALIMVPFLRRWALDSGALDEPDERKVHKEAIPRIGGIAIALSFFFALFLHADINLQIRGILAGTLIIFVTGVVDDLYGISARRKFMGEICACVVTITVGKLYIFQLGDLFGTGNILLPPWLAYPFTVFAVVGVINAINLIDGLDGLAGGVSVIALGTFGMLAFLVGNQMVMLLSAGLLGALLGFLKYNFYPARIFMGDAGSLSVGFVLAFLAIGLTQGYSSVISPIVPVVVLGLPIIDTIWVMSRRIICNESPFNADKTHVHHKILDIGFNHRFTVLTIYGISIFWSVFAVLFRNRPARLLLPYLGISVVLYLILRYVLRNQERYKRILSFDSSRGILSSRVFRKLSESLGFVEPALITLILSYLGMCAVLGIQVNHLVTQVTAILLAASIALIYLTRDLRNDFVLVMLYFAALIFTFLIECRIHNGTGCFPFLQGTTNLLFTSIALLASLRIILRRPGTFFLTTIDHLIFGLNILFIIFLSQLTRGALLPMILIKGGILYLAMKVVMAAPTVRVRSVVWSLLSVLGVVLGRGLF